MSCFNQSTLDSNPTIDLDFEKAFNGFHLTTAEIIYRLPDHPLLLQTYLWQDYDFPPYFPTLRGFLNFWHHNLDGAIKSVRVMMSEALTSKEFIIYDQSFEIH